MEFSIKAADSKNPLHRIKTDCLVIGVFENKKFSRTIEEFAKTGASDFLRSLQNVVQSGDISGKAGSTLLLQALPGITAKRILLIGLGALDQSKTIAEKTFIQTVQAVAKIFTALGAADATFVMPSEKFTQHNTEADCGWAVRTIVLLMREARYRFDATKSKKEPELHGVKKLTLLVDANARQILHFKETTRASVALANGVELAKNLGNMPPNICTPTYLADTAKQLAREFNLEIQVLDRKQIQSLKMDSFLSVTQGSDEPPKLIVLKYLPIKKAAPVVLVGKGVTFDSGGISLKPGLNMDEMKFDMCGAAAVLGTFRAICEAGIAQNVIGIIPATENLPSGRATKPGDVVTSMSGQTIEILNTDAEGRLILCDALTYAERYDPAIVIDIATLTGACVIALGMHNSGLFTRHDAAHDQLAQDLIAAGKAVDDPVWRMPVEEAYQEQLKSNFADIANIGGPPAGSVTAACFLERFTRQYTWAHLDIAGTAWKSGAAKGATGRPVGLLMAYLMQRAIG